MQLRLMRDRECGAKGCTFGRLFVDDDFFCWTLEDIERAGPKIPGETAIPTGHYQVSVTHSNRFNRNLPLLGDVPNFSGVRIHPGNTAANTEGCILVGDTPDIAGEYLGNSRAAFNRLYEKMQAAIFDGENVELEIL